MQDNLDHYHIDNNFVKKSWKSMAMQLDAEMPSQQQPSSSRKWIMILSGLLLLSLTGIGVLLHLYTQKPSVATITKEIVRFKNIYLPSTASASSNKTLSASAGLSTTSKSSTISAMDIKESLADQNIANQKDLISALDINPKKTQIQSATTHSEEEITSVDHLSHDIQYDPQPIYNTSDFAAGILKNRRKKSNIYFGLTGMVSNLSYSGYGINLNTAFKIAPRWSIHTGVGLNFISRNYFIFPFFEKDSGSNLKSADPDLNDANTYYAGLKGFKQVVFPLGIQYDISQKVSLGTGVRLRYTYNETIDKSLKSKVEQNISKDQSVASAFFNNSNIGLYTGFSYEFSPSFSLSLDAEWGLHSLLRNDYLNDPSYRKYDLNLISMSGYFRF